MAATGGSRSSGRAGGAVTGPRLHAAALALLLLAFALAAGRFVWHDSLASAADDSVHYLLMGRYLSPWTDAGPVLQAAWDGQHYPPLFPLLLALTGAAHSLPAAHWLVAVCALVSLGLLYRLVARCTAHGWIAWLVTLCFAASPALWSNLLGILSENLYLALSLALLLWGSSEPVRRGSEVSWRQRQGGHSTWLVPALLLSAVVLTRTIGVALLLAWVLTVSLPQWRSEGKWAAWLPPALAVAFLLSWWWLKPGSEAGHYLPILSGVLHPGTVTDGPEWSFPAQWQALRDAWFAAWMVYWRDGWDARQVLVSLLAVTALAGLGFRLWRGRLDAWYALVYLLVLLIWPHPGQMERLLYPLLPVLLLQAVSLLAALPRHGGRVALMVLALLAAMVVPSLVFYWQRADVAPEYAAYREFYEQADLRRARWDADRQRTLLADLRRVGESTPAGAGVLYFEPAYISLLAGRRGLAFPHLRDPLEFRRQVWKSGAEYVYLSRLHPRDTRAGVDGLSWLRAFSGWARLVWQRSLPESGEPFSVLLRIDRERLAQRLESSLSK